MITSLLVSSAAATLQDENCIFVGDTYDWCRYDALTVNGHGIIPAGSSYTFDVTTSEHFGWMCGGSQEYARINQANRITVSVSTEGRIHWTGESCADTKESSLKFPGCIGSNCPKLGFPGCIGSNCPKLGEAAAAPALQDDNCIFVGDTYDWCRYDALMVNGHGIIPAGSTYTFDVTTSERFPWMCGGSQEYSRINQANRITVAVSTEGRIHWTGESCAELKDSSVKYPGCIGRFCPEAEAAAAAPAPVRTGSQVKYPGCMGCSNFGRYDIQKQAKALQWPNGVDPAIQHCIDYPDDPVCHIYHSKPQPKALRWPNGVDPAIQHCIDYPDDPLCHIGAAQDENCIFVGDTYDWCRYDALMVNGHGVIPAGSTYTFDVVTSERFPWMCGGSQEYSRINQANRITVSVSTEGRIHWTGESCASLSAAEAFQSIYG